MSRERHGNRRWATLLIAAIGFSVLAFPAPGSAKRIIKVVPVKSSVSVRRAADGTITAKAVFTSRYPKCLSGQITKRLRDGYFHNAGAALYYSAADGYGSPPANGWLFPVSRPTRTRWVWRAVWPGSASVTVENNKDPNLPRHYQSTVGAASGLAVFARVEGKIKYRRKGVKIKLLCEGRETNRYIPLIQGDPLPG